MQYHQRQSENRVRGPHRRSTNLRTHTAIAAVNLPHTLLFDGKRHRRGQSIAPEMEFFRRLNRLRFMRNRAADSRESALGYYSTGKELVWKLDKASLTNLITCECLLSL
jgi:hypothetical protein